MTDQTIDARLSRLENLMVTAGDMMLQTSELSRRNAEQIDRNAEQILRLERTMADLTLRSASDRVEFEEWRRTTQAALEKIDRVLDYLMQRDGQ
ncbi:MAG: hypothetical protein AAFO87_04665 [Cyanobacteria bacterium J06607_6]